MDAWKGFYRGYVRTSNKEAKQKYKGVPDDELKTYEEASRLNEFAGVLIPEAAVIDVDEMQSALCVLRIIKDKGIHCNVRQTKRGLHFAFMNFGIASCFTKRVLTCGIVADAKIGKSNSYDVIKYDGVEREIVYDNPKCNGKYDEVPFWLLPTDKKAKDLNDGLLGLMEGGRNDALSRHVFACYPKPLNSWNEVISTFDIINRYVLSEAISNDEMAVILRDETRRKAENQHDGINGVSTDSFHRFLQSIGIGIRFNKLSGNIEFINKPNEPKYANMYDEGNQMPLALAEDFRMYLKRKQPISTNKAIELISFEADQNSYNPVHDYFNTLQWDGVNRLPKLYELLGVSDEFSQTLISKWFVQCIAMAYNTNDDSVSAEGVLTLTGKEGVGKSAFFKMITPNGEWFYSLGNSVDLNNKDNQITALSYWIVEIGEADATLKRKDSAIKGFLTETKRKIRKPYGRTYVEYARTTSYGASTNKSTFLTDESGFRRWWVVEISKPIGYDRMMKFRETELNQLWAQCYSLYKNDKSYFRLSKEDFDTLNKLSAGRAEPVEYEEELRYAFDFNADIQKWKWRKSAELMRYDGYLGVQVKDARKIGIALSRIQKTDERIQIKCIHGSNSYLLPPFK